MFGRKGTPMKKKLAVICAASAVSVMLAGCGRYNGNDNTVTTIPPATTTDNVAGNVADDAGDIVEDVVTGAGDIVEDVVPDGTSNATYSETGTTIR